jgi:hypothetical protein
MVFQYGGTNCFEYLAFPMDTPLKDATKQEMLSFCMIPSVSGTNDVPTSLINADEKYNGKTFLFFQYLICIRVYTSRVLRWDSDSLIAFLGVMRRLSRHTFGSEESSFTHVHGIPYLGSHHGSPPSPEEASAFFLYGLSWNQFEGPGGQQHPRRRPHLPSWVWAGWAGTVEYPGREEA